MSESVQTGEAPVTREPAAQDIRLHLSASPFIRSAESVPSTMLSVIIALIPALVASVLICGMRPLLVVAVCVSTCVASEFLIARFIAKKGTAIGDLSAVVTGLLLAFSLPPGLPLWMAAVGALFAIGIVKWLFGGLGCNIVNPALAARAVLLLSFPFAMTHFTAPLDGSMCGLDSLSLSALAGKIDGIATATPLAALNAITAALTHPGVLDDASFSFMDLQQALPSLLLGNVGGCIGSTSIVALLAGAAFLGYRHIIGLRVPATFIGTVLILSWLFNGSGGLLTTDALVIPLFQTLSGGLFLVALFMATDPVTSPVTPWGKAIFGVGCGVLTFLIRRFGAYPEGAGFAVLLMNLAVPLIDSATRPRANGTGRRRA